MCQLVRHDRANPLLLIRRRLRGIDQQIHLPIRDQSPILHRPHGELGNRHHVQLGQRIRNVEEVVVRVQTFGGAVQREDARVALAGGSVDADQHAVGGLGLDVVEFSDAECDEVGGHHGRVEVGDFLGRSSREGFVGEFGHVGEGVHVFGNGEGDAEDGFAGRFVPAWKGASGIQTLELSTRHDLTLPVNIRVTAPVKSGHLVVQKSSVLDRQNQSRIGRKRLPENERHRGRLFIHANFFHLALLLLIRSRSSITITIIGSILDHDVRCGGKA
mmetsp:Transcript_42218/g.88664  ORF Transcript_42218/g.88664 Transcript_42218/m.88664 type:complete len:273 (+) Transcript_42218:1883-2701(+)